jgi:hypothetical protein
MTFEESLRSWPEAELRQGADNAQFGEAIRAELDRRARECTCYIAGSVSHERWLKALRECDRHQGHP